MATKKCPNGHQYDSSIYGDNCPFCPSSGHTRVNPAGGFDGGYNDPYNGGYNGGYSPEAPTIPAGNAGGDIPTAPTAAVNPRDMTPGGGRTVIHGIGEGGFGTTPDPNGGRKVVGILVSYSHNPSGDVFKIYEGRNLIGRNPNSDIVLDMDEKVSDKHLLIVYREAEGRYRATDQETSNGTFVNGNFVSDVVFLQTGDVIVIGKTKLMFLGIPDF